MTSDLLLGIDVGTTTCKAAVVDLKGREVAHGRRPTPWRSVPTGAEFDARNLATVAAAATIDALRGAPDGIVRGVGVSSMGESGVLLDRHGAPVVNGIAWHDSRGVDEVAGIARDIGGSEFARHTGLPLATAWTIAKWAALRTERAERPKGCRWLSVGEWIVRWLGGEEVAELSLASRTGFLDIPTSGWWSAGLEWAGMPSAVMPPLVQAGTPVGTVTTIPELKGAVLTVGGHDQPCGAVGAGATAPGDTMDSCGTAEAILRGIPLPVHDETVEAATALGLTTGFHALPGEAALLGFFKAGLALKQILRLLGVDEVGRRRDDLDRSALAAPRGQWNLEIGSLNDDAMAVAGIGANASPAALWRAAMEAAARESARIIASIDSIAGGTERLIVAGGWARSGAYRAVKVGVQGSFDLPDVLEAAARGAALFGGLAAGVYPSTHAFPPPRSRVVTRSSNEA
jgi:sugar (pentulose or hexulose) kinase